MRAWNVVLASWTYLRWCNLSVVTLVFAFVLVCRRMHRHSLGHDQHSAHTLAVDVPVPMSILHVRIRASVT